MHGRLTLGGGFTVIDAQQRRLQERAIALGFADLAGYLTARCQQQTSLAQLAGELATTTVIARRLLDHAGLTPPPGGSAPPTSAATAPISASPSAAPNSALPACMPTWSTV